MSNTHKIQTFGLGDPIEVDSADLLGGKGAGLVFMASQGITVPPGFVIPTSLCKMYQQHPEDAMYLIKACLPDLMAKLEKHFGYLPLVSVRSGAPVSMPGMMDTILNVGLDDSVLAAWEKRLGIACTLNCDERLYEMYANVVKGVDRAEYIESSKTLGRDMAYKAMVGEAFPKAERQLIGSIEAVFNSWNNDRAKTYRKLNNISEELGTACVVQAMVFGNMGDTSCTGVLFTRNTDTGADEVVGEFLPNAQGEDVVAGIRTPLQLKDFGKWNPDMAIELLDVAEKLETLKKDAQDIEFTVQDGELYILQTRTAKRSARAALRMALDFIEAGGNAKERFKTVTKRQYSLAQQPQLSPEFKEDPDYVGIGACNGVVSGKVVLTAKEAVEAKEPVILVSNETTPNDIAGMHAAIGVLTMSGGSTSHAAVVARGMNKTAVVGLSQPIKLFKAGTTISICGSTGGVWLKEVPTVGGANSDLVAEFDEKMVEYTEATLMVDSLPKVPMSRSVIYDTSMLVLKPTKEAVEEVTHLLARFEKVTLDFLPNNHPQYLSFRGLVMNGTKTVWDIDSTLKVLYGSLKKEDADRVVILANGYQGPFKVVETVSTLVDLINAESKFILAMEVTPEVAKVVSWQRKAGIEPVVFGEVATSGRSFLSKAQLISSLLAD